MTTLERVAALVEAVRAEHAPDPRLAVFEVEAASEDGMLVLSGATSEPEAAAELHRRIAALDAWSAVVDRVVRLPEAEGEDAVHAVVSASLAPMYAGPDIRETQISQAVLGRHLTVLRRSGRWLECRGGDGYLGWIHAGYLALMDEAAARGWALGAAGETWISLGAEVRDDDGRVLARLPWGACVVREAQGVARLPDGRSGRPVGEMVPAAARERAFPRDAAAICESALRWTGTPYVWGGMTHGGVDCSGFVQSVFRMHGVELPRDSDMQSVTGAPVDPGGDFEQLEAGDLLFFEEEPGRVTHVALSLGGPRIVHSSLGNGGVRTNGLCGALGYERELRRLFVGARRVVE